MRKGKNNTKQIKHQRKKIRETPLKEGKNQEQSNQLMKIYKRKKKQHEIEDQGYS